MELDFPLFSHAPPLPRRAEPPWRPYAVAAAVAAAAWLPLVALAAVEGRLDALLRDPGPHARLLVSLPILLLTPALLNPRAAEISRHFLSADLIRPDARDRYRALCARLLRRRDSRLAHLACLLLAALGGLAAADAFGPELVGSPHLAWRVDGTGAPSAAGLWHAWVDRPLYFYVVAAFVWRLHLWWRFQWSVSRLDLQLAAGHPDLAGGLGFLAVGLRGFQPALFALAAAPAGGLAALVLERRPPFDDTTFTLATAAVVAAALVALVAAPLGFFAGALLKARQRGQLAYSGLSERQLRRFETKWLDAPPDAAKDPLDAPDFSAVIDLSSTVANAGRMRITPFSRTDLLRLAVAALAPFAPVALIEVPAREILLEAAKLLL